ncbi:MAG: CPBP family intramembrane glutamic endopeptidase [Candidatus Neomarinimicrobiota bacterium]|jgi:membrane protease YdiL (CAAX protease family)|nr:CPBP family intramembrane metalloprotease [Candidatus Neomarinimicrobiota bacterium]MDD3967012.1 CPBP family intramembrane metalloprotease [Candidatus Neomarinimicrobiota bacterium]MDX9780566.1 CPBP family intramembrane glutamic endopeptidase [bacterium]
MTAKKLIVGKSVSWKRVILYVGITYVLTLLLCGYVYFEGKKLDPDRPAIKLFTDIIMMDKAAVAHFLETHPEVNTEGLPKSVPGPKGQVELQSLEEQVAVYVSQKYLPIRAFGIIMIFPALVAVILRLILADGFRNSGFRFGKGKNYLIMLSVIVLFSFLSILLNVLISGKSPDWYLKGMGMRELQLLGNTVSPFIFWLFQFLIVGLVANITFPIIMMFGEEYGWRSYLLQNLLPLGFWKANLITGTVWGLWHAPVILMGYNYGYYNVIGVFMFIAVCILLGTFFNYMYIRGNSVILVSAAHGWFNGLVPSVVMLTAFMGKETLLAPLGALGIALMLVFSIIGYKLTNGYDIRKYIEIRED